MPERFPPIGRKLNPGLFPPGGYRFTDADNVTHVAKGLKELVKSLTEYRRRIKRPPGSPAEEIAQQLCSKYPKLCVDTRPAHNETALTSMVVAHVAALSDGPRPERVPFSEVKARAEKCRVCPARVDWAVNCTPCQKKAQTLVDAILAPEAGFVPLRGQACLLARDDLSLAVFLKETETCIAPPGPCWRKTPND